jgi:hypothetical protein
MLFIFSIPVLIRNLWQLKTVVFLHWYLIHFALLKMNLLLGVKATFMLIVDRTFGCLNDEWVKWLGTKVKPLNDVQPIVANL